MYYNNFNHDADTVSDNRNPLDVVVDAYGYIEQSLETYLDDMLEVLDFDDMGVTK